jgi:hypothetical protein
MTIAEELDLDIKKIQNFQTLNEIREKYDLKPLEDGDIVLNSTYVQSKNAAAMQGGMMGGDGSMGAPVEENPFDAYEEAGESEDVEEENPFDAYEEDENGEIAMKGDYAQRLSKAIESFIIEEK